MNWSLGCAFTLDNLIMNFPFKLLHFNCNDCFNIIGNLHRDILVKRIFLSCVKLVINDVIDRNVTFLLPLVGDKKCDIRMKAVRGEEFKSLRKKGKWLDVDILSSRFTGYKMILFMQGKRIPRTKNIYLNKEFRNRITENTNKGMSYGDGKIDTTIQDYIPEVLKQFPKVSAQDITRILKFCWRSLYLHNSYGGDLILKDSELWCYFGNLKKLALDHYYYYIKKLTIKLRVLYKRKKTEWDGYYYFALSDDQYQKYIDLKNKRGRPKKYFNFGDVYLFEIYDECRINNPTYRYIFKVPFISKLKMKKYAPDFVSNKAELIEVREPLKFKDISVAEYKYDVL